jgi:death-on-curing protein
MKETGGIQGIRDKRLLESALAQPQMTIFGKYVCKNIFEMAAAYCYHIAKNHAFIDGNKRTALLVSLLFLKKNGYRLPNKPYLYTLMVDMASSKISKEEIASIIKKLAKR